MKVLGFMSGTSLDAVDMAVLETDGRAITAFGPCGERKLSDATRAAVLRATEDAQTGDRGTRRPSSFAAASWAVAQEHLVAAREFLHSAGIKASSLDLVGFHGQTVLHERPHGGEVGRTVQLGDAGILAKGLNLPVAHDFRTAEVAAGGQLDAALLTFVASALHPRDHARAFSNAAATLRPGGRLFFRDYGVGDVAATRLEPLGARLYRRGDGTLSYAFALEEVRLHMEAAGLVNIELKHACVANRNRKTGVELRRVFVSGSGARRG